MEAMILRFCLFVPISHAITLRHLYYSIHIAFLALKKIKHREGIYSTHYSEAEL